MLEAIESPGPENRIILEHSGYTLEIWPELGGAIARFEIDVGGRTVPLFKQAAKQNCYQASDLGAYMLLPRPFAMSAWQNVIAASQRSWNKIYPYEGRDDSRACVLELLHQGADDELSSRFLAWQTFDLSAKGLRIFTTVQSADVDPICMEIGHHSSIQAPPGTRSSVDTFISECGNLRGRIRVDWPRGDGLEISQCNNLPPCLSRSNDGRYINADFASCILDINKRLPPGSRKAVEAFRVLKLEDHMTVSQCYSYRPAPHNG